MLKIPLTIAKEDIYKTILPEIIELGFFNVLNKKISFVEFHTKLIELSKLKHGVGIAVSIMAQVNIAGQVLKLLSEQNNSFAKDLLNGIIDGSNTISLGVSEKGWKGKLSNLQTVLELKEDTYLLNGEKSFFTNGGSSNYYLVVARLDNKTKIVLIPRDMENIQVTAFSLNFASEATHSSIKFNQTRIPKENIFDLDYSNYSENLRFSEMLSLSAIWVGYSNKLLKELSQDESLKHIFKNSEIEEEIFKLFTFNQMFKSRVLEISHLKDLDENLKLKDYFPYGLEFMTENFYSKIEKFFPIEKIQVYDVDKQLFTFRDILNEIYIRRAISKFYSTN